MTLRPVNSMKSGELFPSYDVVGTTCRSDLFDQFFPVRHREPFRLAEAKNYPTILDTIGLLELAYCLRFFLEAKFVRERNRSNLESRIL